ncbi:carboxymuconolactone decarboxylase family protein [Streptomyces sp. So13.3]|uniref:carboxymuconolactone decarboxylase family protein n=1 Tax=Streptomyces sp. So13.3 TaxID=2136173 RepID=UPI00110739F7|nr:carboxymuconolactone decarboxylase family protein [Streptomyces sp. So13.3]QNA71996.1 carboxymuconolactone decarboxylase family protein [Streptomyces sp. So13.3]
MSRLPIIEPAHAQGAAADLLATVQKTLGVTPNMTKAMANSPAVLKGYLEFSGALATGELPATVRESIALAVAQENTCDYCLSAHTYIATNLAGLTTEQAESARRAQSADLTCDAALKLATSLVRTRGDVTDTDLKTAREAGLNDAEIAEVVAHVALNILTNYFNKAAAVDIDWPQVSHLS